MKILIALSSLHSGGAERVACTLADAWAARGDEVIMLATFSGGGRCFYKLSNEVRVIYLARLTRSRRKSLLNRIARLRAYRELLSEERPDVIVSFLPGVNAASIMVAYGLGIPVIACERTDPLAWGMSAWASRFYSLLYRRADMLTVQTEAVAEKIPAVFPRLQRLRVIPNPIPAPLQRYSPLRAPSRQRKRLVAMGRLSEEKQFGLLIEVFSSIAADWPQWDLVIFGEGRLGNELEGQIARAGLAGRASLGGTTSAPWYEMASSDVFVMTSNVEGFPNALLEAMALGMPCAVFDCPSGPREISSDGRDALLVPLNDRQALATALVTLMGNECLRAELGLRAKASVLERYSLPVVMERWDGLFREVGALRQTVGLSRTTPETRKEMRA
jgi:glycosyltransferase involved in cell wall biosynthesis